MKKRMMSLALVATIAFSSLTVSASAASVNSETSEAVAFLDEFLGNLKSGDLDSAYSVMNDGRMSINENIDLSTITAQEREYIDYVENGVKFEEQYSEEAIVAYEILNLCPNNVITAKLEFNNGGEAIVPFCVEKGSDGFEVCITDQDIEELGYREIKTVESEKKLSKLQSRATREWKDDYEFSWLYGTIYGLDTFSVSRNGIEIDGYQANDMLSAGWETPAEVIYSVVVEHWYGDYVWATTTNAIKKNGYFDVTLVGKNSSQSDLKIRISNQTGAYPRSAGNGTLYSITV